DDEQVRRDLLLRSAERGEEPRGALVVLLALAGGEVAVDRRLHERMHEAERRLRPQDLRMDELARRGGDRWRLKFGKLGNDRELRAVTEHRDRPRDLEGVRRKPREAKQYRSGDSPRPHLGDG